MIKEFGEVTRNRGVISTRLFDVCNEILGITTRRYYQLSSEKVLPPSEKGVVDLAEASRRYIEYLQKMATKKSQVLVEERARYIRPEANRKELRFEKERGEDGLETAKVKTLKKIAVALDARLIMKLRIK